MTVKALAKNYARFICDGFGGKYMAANAPVGVLKAWNSSDINSQPMFCDALLRVAGHPPREMLLPQLVEWLYDHVPAREACDQVLASKNPPRTLFLLLEKAYANELLKVRKHIESCLQAEIDELI